MFAAIFTCRYAEDNEWFDRTVKHQSNAARGAYVETSTSVMSYNRTSGAISLPVDFISKPLLNL